MTGKNLYPEPLPFLFMKELSVKESHDLIDSNVKTFGIRGASRALNKSGYRTPEGKEFQSGTIARILAGSETRLFAPETEDLRPEEPPEHAPEAPLSVIPLPEPIAVPMPVPDIEKEKQLQETHFVNKRILRQQLEDELALQRLKEEGLPDEVPGPEAHCGAGHPHVQQLARAHAVFDRRKPVEIKTDKDGYEEDFFGIPRLQHKPSAIKSQPYEPKSFGGFSISSKNLNVRERK